MEARQGDINIFIASKDITTGETTELVKIINIASGLAHLDLIGELYPEKYNSLKYSFYGHVYKSNEDVIDNIYGSLLRTDIRYVRRWEMELRKLKEELNDNQNRDYLMRLEYLLNGITFDLIESYRVYPRRELEANFISEAVNNNLFDNRRFNVNVFDEWLNIYNNHKLSEITLASSKNSLEYEIKLLLILGLENHDLVKDLALLTFDYVLLLLNRNGGQNQGELTKRKLELPEIPEGTRRLIANYDEVKCEYDEKKGKYSIKLKR